MRDQANKHKFAKVVFLMGPTAGGKSLLAMELASRFPVEIVSVDSAQVYRGMDIGTAKPDSIERAAIRHHLIDIIDPTEVYSAARFRDDALQLISEIHARGRLPMLVGGTMLYFKALREGLSNLPGANPVIRAEIDAEAAIRGWPSLHSELSQIDPVAGARIKTSDTQRIQRALEIYRITGTSMSNLIDEVREIKAPFEALRMALIPPDRSLLHERIADRMKSMVRAGLIEELRELKQKFNLTAEMPSMRCVGYRQAWGHLNGELTDQEMLDRSIYATRQLAKRQLTWIRSTPELELMDFVDPRLTDKAATLISGYLNS